MFLQVVENKPLITRRMKRRGMREATDTGAFFLFLWK